MQLIVYQAHNIQVTPHFRMQTCCNFELVCSDPDQIDSVTDNTAGPDADPAAQLHDEAVGRPVPADFVAGTRIWPPSEPKARARANIRAIRLLDELDRWQRHATRAEQEVLAAFSGWGAVPEIFERDRPDWEREHAELRQLLDRPRRAQARAATSTAYYTPPDIAAAMWAALTRAGFRDGRVLEPGCGSGNFIAHAPAEARMVGVEMDPTTARVAAALYPSAQIRIEGFEETLAESHSFAAAIGGVPFDTIRLHDPIHNSTNLTIPNHFIVKSMNLVAPGGYVVLITCIYTAEAEDRHARAQMAERADLIGAIRLPARTYAEIARTNSSADILVWRVREHGRSRTRETDQFLDEKTTITVVDPEDPERQIETQINTYFARHPRHLLGEVTPRTVESDTKPATYLQPGATVPHVEGPLGGELAALVTDRLTTIADEALTTGLGLTANAETTAIATPKKFRPGLVVPVDCADGVVTGTLR
jgi:SAM-dependent methyltransferase